MTGAPTFIAVSMILTILFACISPRLPPKPVKSCEPPNAERVINPSRPAGIPWEPDETDGLSKRLSAPSDHGDLRGRGVSPRSRGGHRSHRLRAGRALSQPGLGRRGGS